MTTTEYFTNLRTKIDALETYCRAAADGEEDATPEEWNETLLHFLTSPEDFDLT